MIKISHRGNITHPEPERENSPEFIDEAIAAGYDVEIDLRWKGDYYLGHDRPEYPISMEWLITRRRNLWVHTKDIVAMCSLLNSPLRYFFHEQERHTIIANAGAIWTHDLTETVSSSIIPLLSLKEIKDAQRFPHVKGICTDYPSLL